MIKTFDLKQRIILVVAAIGIVLIFIFQRGLYGNSSKNTSQTEQEQQIANKEPGVVSTKPDNLDNSFILPSQTIEITFNLPLENVGEFKNKIEPKTDYQVKLSDDRKTAKIIPNKPFKLGTEFTLIIGPDTKFDPKKTLNRDIRFHFRTIEYKGV